MRTVGLADDRQSLSGLSGLDWGFLAATLLLAAVGLATVHSASAEMPIDYLPRQALWVGFGIALFLLAFTIDYHLLVDLSLLVYLLGLALLVVVLFIGVGPGGTKSWLAVGSFRIGQPAELAKLGSILFLTRYLSGVERRYLGFKEIFVATAIVALPIGLVIAQPDLGTAAMFAPMLLGMLLIAGVRLRWLVIAAVLVVGLAAAGWSVGMKDYQRERVITFLQPETDPLGAGYQVRQSKIAVGSGEVTGRGYMQGTQSQLRFLPALHTDFIFAVLAEEWGFLGVVATLSLFALFIFSALRIAIRARDRAGLLLVVGYVSVFSFHVIYNAGMVVGLLPITGIPVPFLSYGGSFILLNFVGAGLVLNVDVRRHVNR